MVHAWKYDTPVVWPALSMVMTYTSQCSTNSGQTDYLAPEIKETRWEDKASKSKLMSLNPQGTELSIIIPTPFIMHVISVCVTTYQCDVPFSWPRV